jgi:hypothetical protein
MEIYGHCRFSWFGISDTGRELTDIDDARARLWHPLRMAIRFHLFEQMMLPSLAAQTDLQFTLLVTISAEMLDTYHARLDQLAQKYPFIRLNRTELRDYPRMIAPFMDETTANGTIAAAHFRLDDDDALPCSYIARLRRDAERVDIGGLVCYPKGIVGFIDGTRARHGFRSISYHAQGLARIAGPGMLRSPLHMQHRDMGNLVPSYVDPTFIGFHFTQHTVNNTKGYGQTVHLSGAEQRLIDRMIRNNPELEQGMDAPPKCDAELAQNFPRCDGPTIRKILNETLDPAKLAERFGFALP